MPPKGRGKSGGGSKLGWESELATAEFSDSEWNCQVHLILGETIQASNDAIRKIKNSIKNREKFSLLTPDMVLSQVVDKKNRPTSAKYTEVFDSCKNIETGGDVAELNEVGPVVLARLLKYNMLRNKEADLQRIQAKLDKMNGAGSTPPIPKGKKTPPAKGKGKAEEEIKKEWSDLKKRDELNAEAEAKLFIGDEPENGPTHYMLLVGFSESNIPTLLAEQGIELSSIIQIKSEGDLVVETSDRLQFWSDLAIVFRRALKKRQLVDCTRWQLTSFSSDGDGSQLFDEIALLCYDLLDQRAAFDDFRAALRVISTPTAKPFYHEDNIVLDSRYKAQFEGVPLIGQSVNVICHALRESVVEVIDEVEVVEEDKKDNSIQNLLSNALSGFDFNSEEKEKLHEIITTPLTSDIDNNQQLYYKNDSSCLRLAGLGNNIRKKLENIEREMTALYPVNQLFVPYEVDDSFFGKLAEIDYQLQASGDYTESQIKRILLQLSAEALPMNTIDSESGQIIENFDVPFVPWDNPQQLIDLDECAAERLNNRDENLNAFSIYERLNHDSAIQILSESIRDTSACSTLKLSRDRGTILSTYNPVGSGLCKNQSVQSWEARVLSQCGFRQWIEHFQSELTEWLHQWEVDKKQKEEEERQRKAAELAAMEAELEAQESDMNSADHIFIMPDSLKKQDLEKKLASSKIELAKKKSSRKSLKGSAKSSRSSSKTKISNKKSSRSSSKLSKKSSNEKNLDIDENEKENESRFPLYQAYDLGSILSVSGNERKIFTSDGGRIRIKTVGYVNHGDNLSIVIENDDSLLHVYQQNPRETTKTKLNEGIEKPELDDDVKSVTSVKSLPDADEIPSATFSSIFCAFSDGVKASFSLNGPRGRDKNYDTESFLEERKFGHKMAGTASPTPSRETNTSSAKGKSASKGKGKGKNASDTSVTSEPITPIEDDKVQDIDSGIQQVYISTPDGLNIRFGKCQDDKLMVKISKLEVSELIRVITHDSVVVINDEDSYKTMNYMTGDMESVENQQSYKISQSGERTNGENLLHYVSTDPITKNKIMVRSDGYVCVTGAENNEKIHQFPDGTRATNSGNETRIENPEYPLVLFENKGEKCLVILSNGAVIQVESNGSYHLTSASGGSFAVGSDGTVLFTAKQDNAATHIIRQKISSILEVIESDGLTTIQISNTGGTSILKSMSEEGEEEQEDISSNKINDITKAIDKRYFYLSDTGEAFEFFKKENGLKIFEAIDDDIECAILRQQIPEAPQELSATLICPFKVHNNWSVENYAEESIIPSYLKQADLMGRNNPLSKSKAKEEREKFEKTILTQRNFVVGIEVTDEMKQSVIEKIIQLGKEERDRDDNVEANRGDDPLKKQRSQLLNRFLALAAEPDVEALRQKWIEATTPVPPPPAEKAKPKLTQDDWDKIKAKNEKTKNNLTALKQRTVPNYWNTQAGKDFLASGESNVAKEAAKELPAQEATPYGDTEDDIAEDIVLAAIKTGVAIAGNDSIEESDVLTRTLSHDVREITEAIDSRQKPAYSYHRLQFKPEIANFGILEEDESYRMKIELKNTGMFTVRFKMAPSEFIKIKYKMGPIPAGLSTTVEIEMTATGGVLRDDGLYDVVHTLLMTNQNKETTELPILARVIPKSEIVKRKVLKKPSVQLNKNVKRLKN